MKLCSSVLQTKIYNAKQNMRGFLYFCTKGPQDKSSDEMKRTNDEFKGAMKNFLSQASATASNNSQSLWARLRKDKKTSDTTAKMSKSTSNPIDNKQTLQSGTQNQYFQRKRFQISKGKTRETKSTRSTNFEDSDENYDDLQYFEDLANRGYTFDSSIDDPVDNFLAEIFMDSFNTTGQRVIRIVNTNSSRHVRIPQPRSMREIMDSLNPKYVNADPSTEGYMLARQTWQTLNKNYFYSDAEKIKICNKIAHFTNRIFDEFDQIEADVAAGYNRLPELDVEFHSLDFQRAPFRHDFKDSNEKERIDTDKLRFGEFGSDATNWDDDTSAVINEDEL